MTTVVERPHVVGDPGPLERVPERGGASLVVEARALERMHEHPLAVALIPGTAAVVEELAGEELVEHERPAARRRLRRAITAADGRVLDAEGRTLLGVGETHRPPPKPEHLPTP